MTSEMPSVPVHFHFSDPDEDEKSQADHSSKESMPPVAPAPAVVEMEPVAPLSAKSKASPRSPPVQVVFENLEYSIKIPLGVAQKTGGEGVSKDQLAATTDPKALVDKVILNKMNGRFRAGRLTAIMVILSILLFSSFPRVSRARQDQARRLSSTLSRVIFAFPLKLPSAAKFD